MAEQPERPERTANEPPERLTFAQAAERLNISPDAVRMRAKRGTLATVRVNDRTFILWPQPERPHEPRTDRDRSAVRDDALVAHLEDEIRFLRQQLDQQTRIAAVLTQRLLEIPAEATYAQDAHQDANAAPLRGDVAETSREPLRPSGDRLALGWRRWWRRMTRGG